MSKNISRLNIITGNDEFEIKNQARKVAITICGENPETNPDLEIINGDRDDVKPGEILSQLLNSLNTPPFLSPRKVLWLKNYIYFQVPKSTSAQENDRIKKCFEEITEYINTGIPEDIWIIIDGPGLDKRTSFSKACKKHGDIYSLEKTDLSSKDYFQKQAQKIRSFCATAGKNIDPDAQAFLTETVGSDSGRMLSEMEKLLCFIDDRNTITLDDCKNICSRTPEALSWAFADALGDKNIEKAFELVNILTEQLRVQRGNYGLELSLLFSAIGRFQDMVSIIAVSEEIGLNARGSYYNFKDAVEGVSEEVREEYGGNIIFKSHPYRAYMLLQSASRFSAKQLADSIHALLKTNQQLVSGGANPKIALEQLILKICG